MIQAQPGFDDAARCRQHHEHADHDHDETAHGHHHHGGAPNGAIDPKTMLAYQVDHNRQHAAELRALAETLPETAKQTVLEAAGMFEAGSDKLASALREMEA